MTQRGFELRSQLLGPLPIINRFLDRLGLDSLLEQALETDSRSRMPPATALGVVLRNLVQQRQPLYALGDWVAERDPAVLGLQDTSARLNDDCVGRALERLFDADRALLQTEVVVNAIRRFGIDCTEFHNDSTSITFSGDYADAHGQPRRGQATLNVDHGHNKDHRPDLKQLLWILTVSADGAVPVHFRVADGKTEDSQTHQETWDILHRLAGNPQFLYIADSKLCTRENMGHIDANGGRFLTVLPRTRKEDADFREWLQAHQPEWALVRQDQGRDGVADHYFMTEAPWPSAEGYRVAWVLSSGKARQDAQTRQAAQKVPCLLMGLAVFGLAVSHAVVHRHRSVSRHGEDPEQLLQVGPVIFVVAMTYLQRGLAALRVTIGGSVVAGQGDAGAVVVELGAVDCETADRADHHLGLQESPVSIEEPFQSPAHAVVVEPG